MVTLLELVKNTSSTSLELRCAPLKERAEAFLVVGTVVDSAPYGLNPLESLRIEEVRFCRGRATAPSVEGDGPKANCG